MKLEVDVGRKVFYSVLVGFLVLVGAGFGFAQWDESNMVYHDAADVKISVDGVNYGLDEYLSIMKEEFDSNEDSENLIFSRVAVESAYFGGIYSTFDNNYCNAKNPITNACSCPSGYDSIRLGKFNSRYVYLCLGASGAVNPIANFGGMYSSWGSTKNAITNSYTCPSGYDSFDVMQDGLNRFMVCMTTDLENSVIDYFGGMSISSSGPLSYESSNIMVSNGISSDSQYVYYFYFE